MEKDERDVLGDGGYDDGYDEGHDDEPVAESVAQAVRAPEALALAALVLAALSLVGIGLLNGSPYFPQSFLDGGPPGRSVLVATALVGAALALLPVALGAAALRRLPHGSSSRVTAGAAVLLAAVSVVLRLAVAARTAADDSTQFVQF